MTEDGYPADRPSIFDRQNESHPWEHALAELSSTDLTRRAVVHNWRMDPRVSEPREQEMLAAVEFDGLSDGEDWWRRRGEYFYRTLCQPTHPIPPAARSAYLEASNGNNVIPRGVIPSHEQLIHVASLNAILGRLTTAELPTARLRLNFSDLTGQSLPGSPAGGPGRDLEAFKVQVDNIAQACNRRGLDTVRELAGLLSDSLGDTQPPWWAGFAEEHMPAIERADWTSLCQALGLGHLQVGEWLIVWRYEVGTLYLFDPEVHLYRPTVVEANDSPFHYPSAPDERYGTTMPLNLAQRGAFKEVLHPPLRDRIAVESCAYELCQIANPPIVDHNEIVALRQTHKRRLAREYPQTETERWLERHTVLHARLP